MADDDNEDDGPSKLSRLMPIFLGVAVLVLIAGAVGATLFLTGFFDKKQAVSIEQQLDETRDEAAGRASAGGAGTAPPGASAGPGPAGGPGGPVSAGGAKGGVAVEDPKLVPRKSPQLTRYEYAYFEVPRELLVNVTSSRKVMQVQVALMTRYDDRVFQNVKKHEFALRSAMLDVMRQVTEAQLTKPEFRKQLAESLRIEINAVLEKLEDFGGVEEVYFTSFIVQ